MENIDTSVPAPGAAAPAVADPGYNSPAPAAVPAAQPLPAATPAPAATPSYQGGGKTGAAKFFENITAMDIISGAALVFVFGLGCYYYYRKIKFMKSDQAEVISKVEEMEQEVEEIKKATNQNQFG